MTTRRTFIKALAAIPPAFSFRRSWAASDPSRLALIIGNSSYRDAPLTNPANDAKAVGDLFGQAGFTVDSHLNATRAGMMAAIERFGAAAKRSETKLVVFYYAGHGAQLDWRNYLLPVDAVVEKQEDMKQRCIDLSLLLGQLSAAKDKTFVIILDACRNNPFGSTYRPEQKGLSQFDAPIGSLLAYATSPGNVASDGEGLNGLYTEHLVRELGKRGTRIEDALKRVRLNVRLASQGAQVPWETTSLESDVFIFDGGQTKLSETEIEKQLEADVTEWTRIKSSKNIDDWIAYLRNYPNGRFAEIAQMRLTRLLAEVERLAAEKRQAEEQKAREEQLRVEQERAERERIRAAEEQRLAAEREKLRAAEEQRLAAEREKLRVAEEQRLAAEQERLRIAEEKRLAAERKQAAEQQSAQLRRQEERLGLEAARRQEQERLDQERHRLAEAERLDRERQRLAEAERLDRERLAQERLVQERVAKERQQLEAQRQVAEQQRLAQEKLVAAKPVPVPAPSMTPEAALAPVPATGPAARKAAAPMLDIKAGVEVPRLISPSANPFSAGRYPLGRIYTVGDSAVFRQSDYLSGIEERTYSVRVTRVDYDEDRVEYNDGRAITDLMGNFIKNGPVEFDSPVQFSPAEFQVGRKWTAAFRRTQNDKTSNAYLDLQIVKRETITVPAGSFDCFHIEGRGWNTTNGARLEANLWMVPGLNFPVRREFLARNRMGRFGQTERHELVSLRQHATSLPA
jgi:hypothetical protein